MAGLRFEGGGVVSGYPAGGGGRLPPITPTPPERTLSIPICWVLPRFALTRVGRPWRRCCSSLGGGGGGTPPGSGAGGSIGPGMGNAAFGGLITCTQAQVTIGGVSYPGGPITCTLTLPGASPGWPQMPSLRGWWPALLNYFRNTPITVNATEVLSSQITYIPGTKTLCGSIGFGMTWPPDKAISVGAYIHGNLNNAVPILEGPTTSLSAQFTPTIGYQGTWNGSGALGGPSFSGPGAIVSRTWGACGPAPW